MLYFILSNPRLKIRRETDRQTDRQTDRDRDGETDRQKEGENWLFSRVIDKHVICFFYFLLIVN